MIVDVVLELSNANENARFMEGSELPQVQSPHPSCSRFSHALACRLTLAGAVPP
jgi:hypothetical protein